MHRDCKDSLSSPGPELVLDRFGPPIGFDGFVWGFGPWCCATLVFPARYEDITGNVIFHQGVTEYWKIVYCRCAVFHK